MQFLSKNTSFVTKKPKPVKAADFQYVHRCYVLRQSENPPRHREELSFNVYERCKKPVHKYLRNYIGGKIVTNSVGK